MKTVKVVPYNPQWPEIFEKEAKRVRKALGENCLAIHHIGSTAVLGLAAKPIIDMLPIVRDITKVDKTASKAMEALGYGDRGELGMLFRRYFSADEFHVHIWEEGNDEIERHLSFRDYLRTHHDACIAYQNLKYCLAEKYKYDRARYTLSKESFIQDIHGKAGFSGYRLVEALTEREWEGYHRILGEVSVDVARKGLTKHLTLSKGNDLVGAATVEFLEKRSAVISALAIDVSHRGKGHEDYLSKKIEQWLRQNGCSLRN